jgi:hypothetical protein
VRSKRRVPLSAVVVGVSLGLVLAAGFALADGLSVSQASPQASLSVASPQPQPTLSVASAAPQPTLSVAQPAPAPPVTVAAPQSQPPVTVAQAPATPPTTSTQAASPPVQASSPQQVQPSTPPSQPASPSIQGGPSGGAVQGGSPPIQGSSPAVQGGTTATVQGGPAPNIQGGPANAGDDVQGAEPTAPAAPASPTSGPGSPASPSTGARAANAIGQGSTAAGAVQNGTATAASKAGRALRTSRSAEVRRQAASSLRKISRDAKTAKGASNVIGDVSETAGPILTYEGQQASGASKLQALGNTAATTGGGKIGTEVASALCIPEDAATFGLSAALCVAAGDVAGQVVGGWAYGHAEKAVVSHAAAGRAAQQSDPVGKVLILPLL